MALVNKDDLAYNDYSWTIFRGDDPRVAGVPDDTVFNLKEGHELLYLINKMAKINNFKKLFSGLKVERMVRQSLPEDIDTQLEVMQWVGKNWNSFK
ncbi:MAG: hypothetical protein OCD01_08475 [Fibrobacterales bacterium]